MRRIGKYVLLMLAAFSCTPATPFAADLAAPCTGPAYALLDFWLGDWDVYADGKLVGRNQISKILDGCAVQESWSSGLYLGQGMFFYHPQRRQWKQLWLTNYPDSPGGIKEKYLLKSEPGKMTHFEGEWMTADGQRIVDRTVLTRNTDGSIRQVIETSRDGGVSWKVGFDALYKPHR